MKELYVLVTEDGDFVEGHGWSNRPHIRAFRTEVSAKRSMRLMPEAAGIVKFVADDGERAG